VLFALLVQRLKYGPELLTFSRVWFDIPQSVYDPYVIGPKLLFERIPLGDKGFELLHVEVLLRFIQLFIEFGEVAVAFSLSLSPERISEHPRWSALRIGRWVCPIGQVR